MKRYILLVCAMLALATYTNAGPPISGGGGAGAGDFLADGTVPMTGAPIPNAVNTIALGSAAAEWADLFLGDGAVIYGQNDSSATLTSSASKWTANNFGVTTALTLPATLSSAAAVTWTLMDNQASGLSFGATGAADILKVGTLDAGAGVTVGGFVTTTGTVTAAAFDTTRTTTDQFIKLYERTGAADDWIQLTALTGATNLATWTYGGFTGMDFGALSLQTTGVIKGLVDKVSATFDGGGSAIAVNKIAYTHVPFAVTTINQWTVICDVDSGTTGIIITPYMDAYAADTLPTTTMCTTGTAPHTTDGAGAGGLVHQAAWDCNITAIPADSIISFKVTTAPTSATWCTVVLKVTR